MRTYEPKYWNKKGKYQKQYNEMYVRLVPDSGEADTEHGEIIRIISRVYYDHFNNGGCNLSGQEYGAKLRGLLPQYFHSSIGNFVTRRSAYDNDFCKFLDKFVNDAIQYAAFLESAEKI